MRSLLIARIRHHPGQLEFVMSLCKALDLSSNDVILQIDSRRLWKQIELNSELYSILLSEFTVAPIPFPLNKVPLSFWENKGKNTRNLKDHLGKLVSKLALCAIKKFFHCMFSFAEYKYLYLVNDPIIDKYLINNQEICIFSTPVSPTLITYQRLLPGLGVRGTNGELQFFGEFPAPSLSSYWTDLLDKNRSNALLNYANKQKNRKFDYILVADRTPDTDNLTNNETLKALEQISSFLSQNTGFKVIYRKHPRFMQRKPKRNTNLVEAVLRDKAVNSRSHLRVLAGTSALMVSFGGTACFEGISARCPVVEVVSGSPLTSNVPSACMSPYNLITSACADQLAAVMNHIVHGGSREEIALMQYKSLDVLFPGHEDIEETGRKIREAVSLIVSDST